MLIIRITNDGTGTEVGANYNWDVAVTARGPDGETIIKVLDRGRIENHDRRKNWRALVRKVAREAR